MDKNDGAAAIKFRVKRLEQRVAEINPVKVRLKYDAIRAEIVEGNSNFGNRTIYVWQRSGRKEAETAWMIGDDAGRLLIDSPGELSSCGVVPEMDSWRRNGEERRIDPESIHCFYRFDFTPSRQPGDSIGLSKARSCQGVSIKVWEKMTVNVDPVH